jgi:hypothetical protein
MQADPNLLLSFVYRRREEYLESVESSTKPTYRLEGSPTAPAASAMAESLERPRATEEAGHRVHDVYASNENEQLAERQSAQSKRAIRHGKVFGTRNWKPTLLKLRRNWAEWRWGLT